MVYTIPSGNNISRAIIFCYKLTRLIVPEDFITFSSSENIVKHQSDVLHALAWAKTFYGPVYVCLSVTFCNSGAWGTIVGTHCYAQWISRVLTDAQQWFLGSHYCKNDLRSRLENSCATMVWGHISARTTKNSIMP
jgi:hypothetical protein